MPELNPSFLVAVPQLGDPNFTHSIVLMLQHNEDGALGLVINDPTALDMGTFAENHEFDCNTGIRTLPVLKGGPVEPAGGWVLHTDDRIEEKQSVVDGLYVSGSMQTLKGLMASGYRDMRLVLGYAGWGPGQLDGEMAQGAWLSTEVNPTHIFQTPPDKVWHAVLKDMGIEPAQIMLGGGIH